MKVVEATALPFFKVHILFDDGIEGNVDLTELTKSGIFKILQDSALFQKVYTTGYSIAWSDELEIDAIAIYSEMTGKDPHDIAVSPSHYATN